MRIEALLRKFPNIHVKSNGKLYQLHFTKKNLTSILRLSVFACPDRIAVDRDTKSPQEAVQEESLSSTSHADSPLTEKTSNID